MSPALQALVFFGVVMVPVGYWCRPAHMGDLIRGPWPARKRAPGPATQPAQRPRWASERYHSPEERRASILAAKPECKRCGRMFHPRGYIPNDLVCLDCRKAPKQQAGAETPPDPTLFDNPLGETE
ncbi:hypothetical protein GCM10027289_30160 [Tsukamurella serpentis]